MGMPRGSEFGAPGEPAPGGPDWIGTPRYEVVRRIARGAMGSVYEAYDRERRERVALKRLRYFSPNSLFLFKQEFRTLVDICHPNLVRLHELVATEGERIFFSMELVHGTDFLGHVNERRVLTPRRGEGVCASPIEAGWQQRSTPVPGPPSAIGVRVDRAPFPFQRLRMALRQLVAGLQALHTAGKLHRDIKPSNVLVSHDGRVVILDFGIATEIPHAADVSLREREELLGTPCYMAPEAVHDQRLTPASDWYSVGVMLYEALVGHAPFEGTQADVFRLKASVAPTPPSDCTLGIPPDLESLCLGLLEREPTRRLNGPEVLHRLDETRDLPRASLVTAAPSSERISSSEALLVGREAEWRAMRAAFESTRAGRSVTVRVSGRAGMGTSALVRAFLDGLTQRGEALVLRGRAYERESVPYKAVDAVIDALSRHLMHLSDSASCPELPTHMDALARLFPVLRRVPSVGELAQDAMEDPQRARQRGFGALRELVAVLAARQPLVLSIDDIQWGDTDSVAMLLDLVRPPQAPAILLLLAHREEDALTAPFLTELERRWPGAAESIEVSVGPLDRPDAIRLALELLGSDDASAQEMAEALALESEGSPFLIEELARSSTRELLAVDARVTLEDVVKSRLAELPQDARKVVDLVSVGGRPLPVSTLGAAAHIDSIAETVAFLVAHRFVRSGMRDGREIIEPVHDRIRETIVSRLAPSLVRQHHADLAQALEATPDADPEALAMHWLAAGDGERAARFAEVAGQQAAAKLAFDQAARLFRVCLEQTQASPSTPEVRHHRARLAEALQFAGRYEEAARAYLAATDGADADQRIEYQRAAADQLLMAGRMDEGAEMLRVVLGAIGMPAPRSPLGAVFWLLVYRLWLAMIGLRFEDREPDAVQRKDRVRLDALLTLAMGFSIVDVIVGACMQTRHLIEALRKGDRLQLQRAASLGAAHMSATGKPETRLERALIEITKNIADRDGRPEVVVFYVGARGIGLWNRGRWKEAQGMLERATSLHLPGFAGFSTVRLFDTYVHYFLGAFKETQRRMRRLLIDAADRGDLFTSVNARTAVGIWLSLVADDPEHARREMSNALSQWSHKSFSLQHWHEMTWGAEIELYAGDGANAYEHMSQRQRRLEASLLLHAGFVRAMTSYMRGRAAIASIGSRAELRRPRIAEARRLAGRLAREYDAWTTVLALLLRAMAENAAGNHAAAVAALREGIDRAEATDTIVYALPARYRLGELLGGDEGAALIGQAVEGMTAEGVRDPKRWVNCQMPGNWGRR
jgi:serine/threonine protein kinase/tetratricopeptide (TPR) repeat protein